MTDLEFNALLEECGITIEPVRKRHTVYVGTRSVVYFENIEEANEEANRLEANGHTGVRISTSNF